MARRSYFIKDPNACITSVQRAFEDWLLMSGYRIAEPFDCSGVDASRLVEDFIENTDLHIGIKDRNQLEMHARDIGLVVGGYRQRHIPPASG